MRRRDHAEVGLPQSADPQFAELIAWLRLKRWINTELAEHVYPLRLSV
jgi:hypothetical protein